MNEPYIQALRDAIQRIHGCASRYSHRAPVKEEFNGQTLWEGTVEVFDLAAHPVAIQCYAWGYKDDSGKWDYVAVLKTPEVFSPRRAVQTFIRKRADKELP